MKDHYLVLLYYYYTPIEDVMEFKQKHHLFCIEKNLRGRILIAEEGINGTLSGLRKNCIDYMKHLKEDKRFEQIEFKIHSHPQHAFQKLNVRLKKEIVSTGLSNLNLKQHPTARYIKPKELQKLLAEKKVTMLDVRSNYEHQIGQFKDAITLDINHFREFFQKADTLLAEYKNQPLVTYCTGNIRCEKASAYLLNKGFQKIYQLKGGILNYAKETNGKDFIGKCYVFDNRLSVKINTTEEQIIGKCYICHTQCDRMVNCANPDCNQHIPLCINCGEKFLGACSPTCKESPKKRKYDGTGYYTKKQNGYDPYNNYLHKPNSSCTI